MKPINVGLLGIGTVGIDRAIRTLLIEIHLRSGTFNDFGAFLKHRILHQLLLDHFGQLKLVEREQAHHLDQARSEYLLLGELCD